MFLLLNVINRVIMDLILNDFMYINNTIKSPKLQVFLKIFHEFLLLF